MRKIVRSIKLKWCTIKMLTETQIFLVLYKLYIIDLSNILGKF